MKILIGLMLALVVTVAPATAQTKKIPVYLNFTTETTLSNKLAYAVREQLRGSQTYEIAAKAADATFVIELVALDMTPEVSVAASVVLCIENDKGLDLFVQAWVVTSGVNRIDQSATSIIANMDQKVQELLKATVK